ncbi:MAG TPA: beta-propeller domain-containing protein, partial [Candidatus Gracilibacteria bacterium]|nr:beta-propeller domain-containing protein [Candidatus Gracilibacteria bacterium]
MKKLAFLTLMGLSLSMSATSLAATTDSTAPFPDVDSTHPFEEGIEYLKNDGVISGYPDGYYKPANEINRAEFTKIIVGALTDAPQGSNCFPDVKEDWYAKYVCEAKTRGIISGYPDGTFKPDQPIEFSESSKIIANAFGVTGDTDVPDPNSPDWFQPYVAGLGEEGAIPLSVEFFDENITRDEMAEMIYRLKAEKTDEASRTYKEIDGADGLDSDPFVPAKSCADLQNRFESMYELQNYGYGYSTGVIMEGDAVMAPAPTSGQAEEESGAADSSKSSEPGLGGGGSADYSTTNIQVEGVDEADVIKNDGKYIYIIKSNTVRVVEAYPAENMKELVTFTLGEEGESFYPTEMYVDGNQMTVIGSVSRSYEPVIEDSATTTSAEKLAYYPYYYVNRTKVFVVDMTDRTKPKVTRSVEFDGSYNTSRKVGSTLYIIMNEYPNYYYPLYYTETGAVYPDIAPDTFVPNMMDSAEGSERLVVPCNEILIMPKPESFNYIVAAAVPLSDTTKKVSSEVLVGDAQNVYASKTGLYVASTDWSTGIYRPYGDYGTAVYRFLLGDGTIDFDGRGKVPGTILNQFSMDEYNDSFRIATTKNEFVEGSQINNNLYVLDTANMDIEGKLENIAPGEKIYSTRFLGDRGYMVTFKRVDPLFVLDLSDPKNPKLEGKLKVPGYSTYLHPYDENHLIGFGNEVDESEQNPEMTSDDFIYYTAI